MAKIRSMTYRAWDGKPRTLNFLGESPYGTAGVSTTLLTGHNGSHKSTILKELVSGILRVGSDKLSSFEMEALGDWGAPIPLICASGTAADRFPFKTLNGKATEFAVPNYVYIGQRVGSNLLSKKLPLETALTFALQESVHHRLLAPFFGKAYRFARIQPRIEFVFRRKDPPKKRGESSEIPLMERLRAVVSANPAYEMAAPSRISMAMARDLLAEFSVRDFDDLEGTRRGNKRDRISATLTEWVRFPTTGLTASAIRLGLLADELVLTGATVRSGVSDEEFSIYDLSSGEYHVLTTLLALGFSLRDGAIVLIDEPENSLHPQWQQDFMETLEEMYEFMQGGHVVISTHSPLIVAAAPEGSTIVDLSNAPSQAPAQEVTFGASADEILVAQFGVASSRNPVVVDVVQHAVDLIEREMGASPEFESLRGQLTDLQKKLGGSDPLLEVVNALLATDVETP